MDACAHGVAERGIYGALAAHQVLSLKGRTDQEDTEMASSGGRRTGMTAVLGALVFHLHMCRRKRRA